MFHPKSVPHLRPPPQCQLPHLPFLYQHANLFLTTGPLHMLLSACNSALISPSWLPQLPFDVTSSLRLSY